MRGVLEERGGRRGSLGLGEEGAQLFCPTGRLSVRSISVCGIFDAQGEREDGMSGEPCITYDAELVYEGESLGVTKNIVSPGVSVASGSGTSGFAGGRSPRVGMGSHIINDMVPNGLLERGDVGSVGIEVSDPNDRTVREAIYFV